MQGSPLSPILFLISIKNMVTIDTSLGTIILSYLDDILMATTYDTKRKGQAEHQDTINWLTSEAKEGGYNFSPLKEEGIHIQTRAENWIPSMIGTTFIPQREELRWLGDFIM